MSIVVHAASPAVVRRGPADRADRSGVIARRQQGVWCLEQFSTCVRGGRALRDRLFQPRLEAPGPVESDISGRRVCGRGDRGVARPSGGRSRVCAHDRGSTDDWNPRLHRLAPREIFTWSALATLRGFTAIVVGGFLVGFGTAYAGGCTSGHAIAGLADRQLASLVAVCGFFAGGLAATYLLLPWL